jgi:hypothetical protein
VSGKLRPFLQAGRVVLLFAGLALPPLQAFADDASNGVMLPGMQATPIGSIHVLAAKVVLRADELVVSLTTDQHPGATARVTIHVARFGWLGEAEPYPFRQFPEFSATLDGTPLTLTSAVSAFVGSTDISATLRGARLDPFVIAETPPFVSAVAGNESAFNKLVVLGAIQKSDHDALAHWEAARIIGMTLGKSGKHTLAWSYTARPAYALIPFHQLAATVPLDSYCLSSARLAGLLGQPASDRSFVVRQYAVAVGIDDKPVAQVQISATAAPHAALVAFCGSKGIAMTARVSEVSAARTDSKGVVHILTIGGPK